MGYSTWEPIKDRYFKSGGADEDEDEDEDE